MNPVTLVIAKATLGAGLALGFLAVPVPHPVAHAEPAAVQDSPAAVDDVYAREVGDDNADGVIMEDESGWDCATMGNLICGPRA